MADLPESLPLKITISGDEVVEDQKPYTFFNLSVSAGNSSWTIARRYRQFRDVNAKLTDIVPSKVTSSFPSKTLLSDKLDKHIVEKRKKKLQAWLDEILTIPAVLKHPAFTQFVDPNELPAAKFLNPSKTGYLQKFGDLKTNKRWFALQGNLLYYYKTTQSSEPQGVIELATSKIEADKKDDSTFYIQINKETYTLRADSQLEMSEWVIALRQSRIGSDSMNDNYLRFLNSVQKSAADPASGDKDLDQDQRTRLMEFLTQPALVYNVSKLTRNRNERKKAREGITLQPTSIGALASLLSADLPTLDLDALPVGSPPNTKSPLRMDQLEADSESNIQVKTEGGSVHLRAGTMEKLLEKLCDWSFGDGDFIEAFLYTFNSFTTPHVLLDQLLLIYNPPKKPTSEAAAAPEDGYDPMRARILVVLSKWIEVHVYDFIDDPDLCNKLLTFIGENTDKPGLQQAAARQIRLQLQLKLEKKQESESDLVGAPMPILPTLFGTGTFDFFDLDPVEIGRQITIIQSGLLKKIPLQEFLNQKWNKKQQMAPNLLKLIGQFNQTSKWVSSMIVRGRKPNQRAALMSRFIDVAAECQRLNNFDSIAQITAGLQNSSVFRLKRSWELVHEEKKAKLDQLLQLFDSSSNFDNYRSALAATFPPCIPYIGSYLTDLTFIEDGNPEYVDEHRRLINFEKRYMLAKVLANIQKYQTSKYVLRPVPQILNYLTNLSWVEDDELYKLSLEREPRVAQNGPVSQ